MLCLLLVGLDQGPSGSVELEGGGGDVAGTGIKAKVSPFPDTYYNVFDPKENFRPHHRWSKRQVRDETKRIQMLIGTEPLCSKLCCAPVRDEFLTL